MFNTERDLVAYLETNWSKHFPKFKLLGFDIPIKGCLSLKKIGLVDIIFTYRQNTYFVEIKHSLQPESECFWGSLKILGYVKADHLYHFNEDAKPIVMLNKENLNYDYRVILHTLGIGWIAYNVKDDNTINFEISFKD